MARSWRKVVQGTYKGERIYRNEAWAQKAAARLASRWTMATVVKVRDGWIVRARRRGEGPFYAEWLLCLDGLMRTKRIWQGDNCSWREAYAF